MKSIKSLVGKWVVYLDIAIDPDLNMNGFFHPSKIIRINGNKLILDSGKVLTENSKIFHGIFDTKKEAHEKSIELDPNNDLGKIPTDEWDHLKVYARCPDLIGALSKR